MCERCGQRYKSKSHKCDGKRKRRITCDVGGPFFCKKCNRGFNTKQTYTAHLRLHSIEQAETLNDLAGQGRSGKDGSKKDGLQKTRTFRPRAERLFPCENCSSSFMQKSNLVAHQKLHSPNNPHVCALCYKPFLCAAYLAKHQKVHHMEKQESIDKRFEKGNNQGKVICNMQVHHVEKHDSKDKRFENQNGRGKDTHREGNGQSPQKETSFACKICAATFSYEAIFRKHIKIHVEDYPNICLVCSKCFLSAFYLNKHMEQKHLVNNKPQKARISRRRLWKRKWTAPKKKEFSCSLCSSSFTLESTLVKHRRLHSIM